MALIFSTKKLPPRLERYLRTKDMYWSLILIFIATIGISVWALYKAEQASHNQSKIIKFQSSQIYTLKRLAKQNHTAVVGLCALRDDLDRRVTATKAQIASSENFLLMHPNGIPGIPVSFIRAGIKAQQLNLTNARRSLKALDIVRCHMEGS